NRFLELRVARRRRGSELGREWVPDALVWIIEGHAEALNLRAERRAIHHVVVCFDERRLVEHAESAADGRPALAAHVVRESEPRRDVPPGVLAASFRAAGIAGKDIAGRGVRKTLRLQPGDKALGAAKLGVGRQEGIPPDPEV